MNLLKVFPNLNDKYETIKNLKPLEIRQIKKNINKLKPIMPLVIVKTLNGRGVNPARNSVAIQIRRPSPIEKLSFKSSTLF